MTENNKIILLFLPPLSFTCHFYLLPFSMFFFFLITHLIYSFFLLFCTFLFFSTIFLLFFSGPFSTFHFHYFPSIPQLSLFLYLSFPWLALSLTFHYSFLLHCPSFLVLPIAVFLFFSITPSPPPPFSFSCPFMSWAQKGVLSSVHVITHTVPLTPHVFHRGPRHGLRVKPLHSTELQA